MSAGSSDELTNVGSEIQEVKTEEEAEGAVPCEPREKRSESRTSFQLRNEEKRSSYSKIIMCFTSLLLNDQYRFSK